MTQRFDDRVTIYLAIESIELTASMLTTRLGTRPDREWLLGDVRGKTGKRWACHGWVVETTVCSKEEEGRPASELIPIAEERFGQKVESFAKLVSSLGDSANRYAVLAVLASEIPGIELTNSFLRILAEFGGTFQIDLSCGDR